MKTLKSILLFVFYTIVLGAFIHVTYEYLANALGAISRNDLKIIVPISIMVFTLYHWVYKVLTPFLKLFKSKPKNS